ncbi:hypothetical protein RHOER0001_6566 [Rhodococcus erythropolis SK121]|nr:hypothetical protein RHOER0001_6566 [Rhodococcus erythropolis SK121]
MVGSSASPGRAARRIFTRAGPHDWFHRPGRAAASSPTAHLSMPRVNPLISATSVTENVYTGSS